MGDRRSAAIFEERGLAPEKYEFQMLLGVRPDLGDELVREGHRLRIYVPFGRQWYEYSLRRLQENRRSPGTSPRTRSSACDRAVNPVIWAEAEGCRVVDSDGRSYIDLSGGSGVAALGHRNPEIGAAIARQAERCVHALGDLAEADVAAEVGAAWGEGRAVMLGVTGEDAVEIALRTASSSPAVTASSRSRAPTTASDCSPSPRPASSASASPSGPGCPARSTGTGTAKTRGRYRRTRAA